jgi:transcription elongation GreA/GreB family factor
LIRTLTVGADPRNELKCRLRFLQDVEIPLLQAEWGEPGHLGMAALRAYSERELQDISRLLTGLTPPFLELGSDEVVRLNDCVTLQDQAEPAAEEMIVHDARLIIRAPGYISADSVLGAAVLGRQIGDLVRVDTRSGTRTYVLRRIRRA